MIKHNFKIRFHEGKLRETSFKPQTEGLHKDSSLRELQISSVGFEMLTALVGKGMTPSQRRIVADSLFEIMQGQIPLDDDAIGNIYTEVYGETIGPLITCLERGGNFEIIRLAQKKGADLLLVDQDSKKVILQECKGSLVDYNKFRNNQIGLDVCRQMRDRRNKGRKQLQWPDENEFSNKRVRIIGNGSSCTQHSEKAVVVTAVPDGRLKRNCNKLEKPSHDICKTNCAEHCLFSSEPTLVCVLSTEKVEEGERLDDRHRNFFSWYKACERAIWGSAHGTVGQTFSETMLSWSQLEIPRESQNRATPILIGLLDQAIQRNVYVDFGPIFQASESLQQPELMRAISYMHDLQGEFPRPTVNEIEPEELGNMMYRTGDSDISPERMIGNWRLNIRGPMTDGEGTLAEAAIQSDVSGAIVMRIVPNKIATPTTPDDLSWGISTIVSANNFPNRIIYDAFIEETASWNHVHTDTEVQDRSGSFVLGKVLWSSPWGWPFSFPFMDRKMLKKMYHCCSYCDELADFIEDALHFPTRLRKYWYYYNLRHRHKHCLRETKMMGEQPIAFVTNDARGFMSIT